MPLLLFYRLQIALGSWAVVVWSLMCREPLSCTAEGCTIDQVVGMQIAGQKP